MKCFNWLESWPDFYFRRTRLTCSTEDRLEGERWIENALEVGRSLGELKKNYLCYYTWSRFPPPPPFPTSSQFHSLPFPCQSPFCCLCPCVMHKYSLVNPSAIFHPVPPAHLWQLSVCSMYLRVCFYFVFSLWCSLDSTYKWDCVAFVLHCLAYFTLHSILQIHPCYCKR